MLGAAIFLCGVAISFAQIGFFLWSGEWHSVSIIDAALLVAILSKAEGVTWLARPETWLGLHSVLAWLPAGVTLILCGIAAMLYEAFTD